MRIDKAVRVVPDVVFDHQGLSLWPKLLSAEKAAIEAHRPSQDAKYNDSVIGVRVLGFFLEDFWKHNAHSFGLIPYYKLREAIASCLVSTDVNAQNQKLYNLGLFYRNHLMRVFRSNGGPVPIVSEHPSPPSFEKVRQDVMAKTPTTSSHARKNALFRDGFRCMTTGAFDVESCILYPELRNHADMLGAPRTTVECAHIFSETAQIGKNKEDYATSAIAILQMFGVNSNDPNPKPQNIPDVESLLGGNVNNYYNILTMTEALHKLFDHLLFWFEAVIGSEHTYDVKSADPEFFKIVPTPPRRVIFAVDPACISDCTAKGKPVPKLPSPSLLAMRAACSRVAHMAGAAEQADQIARDMEDTLVLAEDGTSAELFVSRLMQGIMVPKDSG
ncbi:hypothetical protein R3P38DRAFT_3301484 [Favolaschia claudopus]|uniref:HNH nuclease domain-containing protein n=1 Tax=Favolaschia claudopus TaxID=2862362 RepID=A0AAW0EIA9_9AGAR